MTVDAALAPGQSIGMLHIIGTNLNAAPAHDALGVISNVERVIVEETTDKDS